VLLRDCPRWRKAALRRQRRYRSCF
jgi:hypothetical protein